MCSISSYFVSQCVILNINWSSFFYIPYCIPFPVSEFSFLSFYVIVFISNLRWNKLQDSIPPEIGELKQLTHLWVTSCFQLTNFCSINFVEFVLCFFMHCLYSAAIWALIILRVKSRRSLQIFRNFVISSCMKIVWLGESLLNWEL